MNMMMIMGYRVDVLPDGWFQVRIGRDHKMFESIAAVRMALCEYDAKQD